MSNRPAAVLLALLGLDIALLLTAAALTPEQSPILPIEISVVLAVLGIWMAVRRSRVAAGVCAVASLGLVALTVHILLGDLGSSGPRELVPDVLLLISFTAGAVAGAVAARPRRQAAVA